VEGVTLASLHAAKGLEWDVVFLAGLSEGLLPISLAETPAALEEERRLLYVGVTRARERLEMSFARARTPGSRGTRKASRFLDGLWPSGGTARAGGAEPPAAADPALLARLREWRTDEARRLDRPAYTVLADRALEDVATLRPATIAELARVRGIGPVKLDAYGQALLGLVARR
ncbi:MAG: ATP-dependent DNA helicase UvrD2, partial [Cellulomonas sp.]|nr:ATP-dependent DNA helicase UvrD2 [Cellulomonas sp.]